MAGVTVRIPGQVGILEARAARLAALVQWHWNVATAPPDQQVRRPSTDESRLQPR
jgi:hypothetical protein